MRIRQAEEKDMPRIIEIWQEAFGDSKEEIEAFFRFLQKEVRTYVAEDEGGAEEGRIAGQLCVLPALLFSETGEKVPAAYLYAVATAEEFRNRGICTLLLKEVHKILQAENRIPFLVPAEEKLLLFYQERGYFPCFSEELTEVSLEGDTEEDIEITPISSEEYIALRKKAFGKTPHAELSKECVKYALHLHKEAGGSCVKIRVEDKEYGILYFEQTNNDVTETKILIQEVTAAEKDEAEKVAEALLSMSAVKSPGAESKARLRRSCLTCISDYISDSVGSLSGGFFNLVLD